VSIEFTCNVDVAVGVKSARKLDCQLKFLDEIEW
jgi:hypothetical protein